MKELEVSDEEIEEVFEKAKGEEVKELIDKIKDTVEEKVKAKGIPTLIYQERKHMGLYKE